MSLKDHPRYPYTFAADFVREHCLDYNEAIGRQTTTISRSQAAQIMGAFEKALGLTHEEMACKLADCYLEDYPQ